jgi:uncharacterized membrane protein required for colicin V production
MLGFLFVFVGIVVVQSIVYKVVTESFKIGGLADRVGGATIGVFQGMLFLSSLLYILAFVGVPSQSFRQYSKIYKSVVNIAPQVLDLFTTVQGQSMDDLQEIAKEKGLEKLRGMVKSGEAVADSVRENRYLDQVEKEKGARVRQLDSLKSAVRR